MPLTKSIAFLSLTFCLLAAVVSTSAFSSDFRKTSWGMSREQVLGTEKTKPGSTKGSSVVYVSEIANKKAAVVYNFVNNKLITARYIFLEKHTNKNDYISDYQELRDILAAKYGKSLISKQIWKNNLYKNDASHKGMAVSVGHLLYFEQWEKPETEITISLYGDNFKINTVIDYTGIKYKELAEKEANLKKQDDL